MGKIVKGRKKHNLRSKGAGTQASDQRLQPYSPSRDEYTLSSVKTKLK